MSPETPYGQIEMWPASRVVMQKSLPRRAEQAFSLVKKSRSFLRASPRDQSVLFVAGVQRSGTTLLMRIFDRSWKTEVFHEHYARAYERNSLRDLSVLRRLISESDARFVVFKALNDSFRLGDLQSQFDDARAIWVFRQYDDVVNSILRKWPRGRNDIDEIVVEPTAGGWRGQRMSSETLRTLRRLYRPGMSNASAHALFWYYRNQLLFDQHLERSGNVMLLNYDAFVTDVRSESRKLQLFAGVPISDHMLSIVTPDSVGKDRKPDILPEIRAACDEMYKSLLSACTQQQLSATLVGR